jgi:hypothetical protein
MEATGATVSYLLAKYHLYEFLVLLLIIYLKKIAHIRLHELLVAYIYISMLVATSPTNRFSCDAMVKKMHQVVL